MAVSVSRWIAVSHLFGSEGRNAAMDAVARGLLASASMRFLDEGPRRLNNFKPFIRKGPEPKNPFTGIVPLL